MAHLLAIDLGTSSVKVALVHADTLTVSASASAEYPIYTPMRGYAEQDPAEWWKAVITATQTAMAASENTEVIGIGVSGQMHGAVLLDSDLNSVHPAIIWPDTRASAQVNALANARNTFDATLPGPPAAGFAAASFLWLKENRPDVLAATYVWCLPKDMIGRYLTGQVHTEPSDAAASWLFDVARGRWAEDVVAFCGLSMSQMPEVVSSHAIIGTLTSSAAAELGIPDGIPVVAGSADLPAQGIGCGVVDSSTVLVTLGTGGQIFVPVASPPPPPDDRYY
ncbi:MAG: FGGY family carbohydrate kinase, partial [Chloroflexota bacterium]